MKWVTREHVHVDRVACPWLIKRFVDKDAEFVFVPRDTDPTIIKDGIPFDMPGVELGHHGNNCSFDAIVEKYNITDPAVKKIQEIVHGADTDDSNAPPESDFLEKLARGYRMICKDDHETLEKEFYLYDAMYAYFLYEIRKK